jgi:hypothetical protein
MLERVWHQRGDRDKPLIRVILFHLCFLLTICVSVTGSNIISHRRRGACQWGGFSCFLVAVSMHGDFFSAIYLLNYLEYVNIFFSFKHILSLIQFKLN